MKKCYTIDSIKNIQNYPYLDAVQYTLNGHQSISKRNSVKLLASCNTTNQDIFVHCDFITSVARYALLNPSVQHDLISEIADIIQYAETHTNVKGIVIHTDTPFRKEIVSKMKATGISQDNVGDYAKLICNSSYYNKVEVVESIFKMMFTDPQLKIREDCDPVLKFMVEYFYFSYEAFYWDLRKQLGLRGIKIPKCKVYFENTTKVALRSSNTATDFIPNCVPFLAVYSSNRNDLIGLCYDLEHAFASNDYNIKDPKFLDFLHLVKSAPNLMVHLNTIEGVERGSYKDRHSATTIFECSQYPSQFYIELAKLLESSNIPFIREVKKPVMEAEVEYLTKQGL